MVLIECFVIVRLRHLTERNAENTGIVPEQIRSDIHPNPVTAKSAKRPEITFPVVVMDSGFDVLRRPGMTKSHLVLAGGRLSLTLALLLPLLLLGMMTAVETSGRGTEHAVMPGVVTGDTADHGALDAALGVGRSGQGQRQQSRRNQ